MQRERSIQVMLLHGQRQTRIGCPQQAPRLGTNPHPGCGPDWEGTAHCCCVGASATLPGPQCRFHSLTWSRETLWFQPQESDSGCNFL